MAEVVQDVKIERPPSAVWAALADFAGISRWASNVDHSCLTTQQSDGVGTIRRVQVGRNAFLERVVAWEPGGRLAYTIDGLPPIVRSVTNTWELTGHGGSTTVRLSSRVEPGPRPPQKVAARLVARALGKASRQMLAGLKTHVEEVSA